MEGQGEDLPLVSPAGPGTTDAPSFVAKQCVALTHSSCVCSAGYPNISLLLSGKATFALRETTAASPDKIWPFPPPQWQMKPCHPRRDARGGMVPVTERSRNLLLSRWGCRGFPQCYCFWKIFKHFQAKEEKVKLEEGRATDNREMEKQKGGIGWW